MFKQKTLVFDIETAPILAYVWGLKDQNISLNQIKQDWSVMAWSAKWLGDPANKIMYFDNRKAKDLNDDKEILKPLWNLLDDAEIVITQNGKSFDSPKINARFIMNGMNPPSPYKHLDTYRIIKSVARFTSHKLEYLTEKLCTKYKKLKHKKFPGQSLWNECLKGNIDAWNEMKVYNIQDVLSTEELYNKIKAWTPSSMPAVFIDRDSSVCRICGQAPMEKRGVAVKQKLRYQRYQCKGCGSWQQGEVI